MAAIHGKSGTVTFTGSGTLLITSWTVNPVVDMAESTSTSDVSAGYKKYLSGWKDWTCSAETNYDSSGLTLSATLGVEAALVLDTVDGLAFSGQAFCTGHTVSNDMGDVVKATWSFQGNGALGEA